MTMPRLEWTVESLLERVAELEEAIAPFARIAPWFEHMQPMHSVIASGIGDVSVADILAARNVLVAGK
jgi:hypothetical protein